MQDFISLYISIVRWILPVFAVIFIYLLKKQLIYKLPKAPLLANLMLEDGTLLPVTAYESSIGRSRNCEICLPVRSISRQHAVLTYHDGFFRIKDTKSRNGIIINGESYDGTVWLELGDEIELSGVKLILKSPTDIYTERDVFSNSDAYLKKKKKKPEKAFKGAPSPVPALFILSLIQVLACGELLLVRPEFTLEIAASFLLLAFIQWAYSLISYSITKISQGPEIGAFFLSTLGLCVAASASPENLLKQLAAIVCGIILFGMLLLILKNTDIIMKLRYVAGGGAIILLIINLIMGEVRNGAKNWINLGFITIQPSEFIKIAFIFASAVTLEWLLSRKNQILLMGFSGFCIGTLFLMEDFGTALIFFVTFIIIYYLSTGNLALIGGICGVGATGGALIVKLKPYILRRFAAWRNVFEYANSTGYQQSRTLIAISAGGLLGIGGGRGFLRGIVASDTDLVLGIVSEEWGFIIAMCAVACLIMFLLGAVHNAKSASSSYYAIAGCAAAGLFLFQSGLNLFGSTDVLPLTGVTYVFVSNGGSSMVACWGMLAFIKSIYLYSANRMARNNV